MRGFEHVTVFSVFKKHVNAWRKKKILATKIRETPPESYFRKLLMIKKSVNHEFYIYNKFDIN